MHLKISSRKGSCWKAGRDYGAPPRAGGVFFYKILSGGRIFVITNGRYANYGNKSARSYGFDGFILRRRNGHKMVTWAMWNIWASAAPEFSRIFRRGIPQNPHGFYGDKRQTVQKSSFQVKRCKLTATSIVTVGKKERKAKAALKRGSRKGDRTVSLFRQSTRIAVEGERARRRGEVFRFGKGSICRHNFTGIAYQECRWKVDYCFSIRYALSPVSLLNGRRSQGSFAASIHRRRNLSLFFSRTVPTHCTPAFVWISQIRAHECTDNRTVMQPG